MRLLPAALWCCSVLLPSLASGEPNFPYKAAVTGEDVDVRSGPGQTFYPTDKLRRGQQVEVYRHAPGGWCAIRPVDGSFTWVSGRYLSPTRNGLAVVTEEGIAARVGSQLSELRDVIQVRLHKGELVEIVESPHADDGLRGWYKIAPPAGEFRWVEAKYLDPDSPREGIRLHRLDRTEAGTDRTAGPPREFQNREWSERDSNSPAVRSAQPRSLSADEYQKEIDRTELDLSAVLVQPPDDWQFDALRGRAGLLLAQAQTAVERGRARLLADRIAEYEGVKRRHETLLAQRDRPDRARRLPVKPRPAYDLGAGSGTTEAQLEINGRFDGVGRLTQVVSSKTGTPRYALVDASGQLRCYVTPSPGVNMQHYVGHTIGVTGTRQQLLDPPAAHIMAQHVTPLEGSMLR
jgi:hypothetical protein